MDQPSYTSRRGLLNLIMVPLLGRALATVRPAAAETSVASDGLSAPEAVTVAEVIDGRTLRFAGGDTVRLSGIETPEPDLAPGDAAVVRLAEAATAALSSLVAAGPVALRQDIGKRDRYGRRLAQASNGQGLWLQAELVAGGHARVHGDGRNRMGLRTLLQREAVARAASRGLWQHPAFAVRNADDPQLSRLAGSFQIVEGLVFAATTVKGTGYINFGADRRTDLTLVLKNPVLDLGIPDMLDLGWLTARPIRCRGWLDLHDGPSIDIGHPEQIEVLET